MLGLSKLGLFLGGFYLVILALFYAFSMVISLQPVLYFGLWLL
jgi:hypothetical protein